MTSKARVRSMQRGASRRDRTPRSEIPDYENFKPQLRPEDAACLGVSTGKFQIVLDRTGERVAGYMRAGYRRPQEIAKLLNRAKIRTAQSTEWTPRLVWFLQGYLHHHGYLKGIAPKQKIESNPTGKIHSAMKPATALKHKLRKRAEKYSK